MNVPKLRFKADDGSEFPEWEEKRLGDVGTVAMCKRVFKEQTSENGEVPFFKIGTFGDKPDAYISYKLFDELRTKYPYPKKGTVLLSASGTVGRQVIYNGEDAYYQDSNIVWLEHDDTIMDGFLKQFYSIVKWKGLEGSTIKRLYNKTILDTIFYLPSLPEQSKIADFLSTIDEIIQSTESELTVWQERKKGVMQKIFNREVRFKADDGSAYPEWEEKKLGEVFFLVRGQVLPVAEMKECPDEIYCYPVYSSQTKNNGIVGFYKNYLYENAITWTTDGANAGTVKFRKGKFYCTNVCGVLINTDKNPYANECIAEMINYISHKYVYKAGNPKLMNNVMADMIIKFPSLPEQQKIADLFSSIDQMIEHSKQEVEYWESYKKGLLQQMFV